MNVEIQKKREKNLNPHNYFNNFRYFYVIYNFLNIYIDVCMWLGDVAKHGKPAYNQNNKGTKDNHLYILSINMT